MFTVVHSAVLILPSTSDYATMQAAVRELKHLTICCCCCTHPPLTACTPASHCMQGRHDPGKGNEIATMRQLLFRRWARWNNWYKNQPLDQIRHAQCLLTPASMYLHGIHPPFSSSSLSIPSHNCKQPTA